MPSTNRRQFLQTTAATGIGYWVAGGIAAQESKSPNNKIRMASIGIGGKGSSDSADAANAGEMVAICDTDEGRLNAAGKKWPQAKTFTDFRSMLEKMGNQIDAVTVSTADHTHAPAAAMAMRMGKHCFCQKPLTHSIYEARVLGQIARQQKVATQMGNQGTADSGLRQNAARLRAGMLGAIKEIHIWTNRPIWPQGIARAQEQPVPPNLKWDLWLGPAPCRPYAKNYHPFAWRGWWDFGTGALGDIGCHVMNLFFMALDLREPASVSALTSGHNKDSFPSWSIVTWKYPATPQRPALKMFWYDGGKVPPQELVPGEKMGGGGWIVVGQKGTMINGRVLGGKIEAPQVDFPKSPGHFAEWIEAIRGGKPAMSNFPDFAGPLTEVVLAGNLAVYVADQDGVPGKEILWDAKNLQARNAPEVAHIIRREYRKGWTL